MASESSVMGLSVLGVIVGLAILLWATATGDDTVLAGGGVIVLLGVALMTIYISRLEGPASGH